MTRRPSQDDTSAALAADVDAFLATGRRIAEIPPGASALDDLGRPKRDGGWTAAYQELNVRAEAEQPKAPARRRRQPGQPRKRRSDAGRRRLSVPPRELERRYYLAMAHASVATGVPTTELWDRDDKRQPRGSRAASQARAIVSRALVIAGAGFRELAPLCGITDVSILLRARRVADDPEREAIAQAIAAALTRRRAA